MLGGLGPCIDGEACNTTQLSVLTHIYRKDPKPQKKNFLLFNTVSHIRGSCITPLVQLSGYHHPFRLRVSPLRPPCVSISFPRNTCSHLLLLQRKALPTVTTERRSRDALEPPTSDSSQNW